MMPFAYRPTDNAAAALRGITVSPGVEGQAAQYFAGGTVLLDLMKLGVMQPPALIDINALASEHGGIEVGPQGVKLGALVRMAEAAEHAVIRREYPVLSEALSQAASPQLRNMASLGGNVLQRTRCLYFRDRSWAACNKRNPGSGCAALEGRNRRHAVLGVSHHCIAHYPGDFANALVALGAEVQLADPSGGTRIIPFEDLHRVPGDTPHLETNLKPGELVLGFLVPAGPWTRRSRYLKVRDRASYDFALASAAVALHLAPDGTVIEARIGLGGVAAKPWRAHEAEVALRGRRLNEALAGETAEVAFAGSAPHRENAFKVELGRRTLVRALVETAAMDVSHA